MVSDDLPLPIEGNMDSLKWLELMICYRDAPGFTPSAPDGILPMLAQIRRELQAHRELAQLLTEKLDQEYIHHTNHVREWYGYVYDKAIKLVHPGRVMGCPD